MDENFNLSDSDDQLEEDDKLLLESLKKSNRRRYDGDNDAVFGIESDEGDEEEENDEQSDIDMGSDIEDRENDKLPDDRAWGQKRKHFYSTDYVDQDYAGTLGAEEEELAKMEEEEAKNIQKRLMEQLNDADFSLADIADATLPASETKPEAIEADLTQLTKRQKLDLFQKEAPEFSNLVEDFLSKLADAKERILPVLKLVNEGKLKKSSASQFLEIKYRLILNYCTNIAFYLLLKAKRIPVKNHPVLKCLFRYRQLLMQLQPVDESIISPQVTVILDAYSHQEENDDNVDVRNVKKRKKLLKVLKKAAVRADDNDSVDELPEHIEVENLEEQQHNTVVDIGVPVESDEDISDDDDDSVKNDQNLVKKSEKQEKRAITYEMAKNKGLTPKRSKEQRNPRVKHRNKFRKATIRRRGQVRMPRKEIPVYGGEPTGIKIGLKKGRKLM